MNLNKGLYTVLITPFDSRGRVDFKGLELLIEEQVEAGVSALVFLGTTSETPSLEEDEKKEILKLAKHTLKDRVPFIVGIGESSTAKTARNLALAISYGAGGALVITPPYNKPSQEGLFQHYKSLSKESSIPLIVYHNPGRAAVQLDLNTLLKIGDLPFVKGIKETSGNLPYFMDVINLFKNRDDFLVLAGDDLLSYPLLALGADGLISAASQLIPEEMALLVKDVLEGRFEKGRSLFYKLYPLFKQLVSETNPVPLKKGLNLKGKPSGSPRLPLVPLTDAGTEQLKQTLCSLKIL